MYSYKNVVILRLLHKCEHFHLNCSKSLEESRVFNCYNNRNFHLLCTMGLYFWIFLVLLLWFQLAELRNILVRILLFWEQCYYWLFAMFPLICPFIRTLFLLSSWHSWKHPPWLAKLACAVLNFCMTKHAYNTRSFLLAVLWTMADVMYMDTRHAYPCCTSWIYDVGY